ncbi:MAG TPA: hypothetical protein VFB66_01060 [Tepidisphaeraceae bacterium]|nr:hypothetical protein [Tepidisphaeraceae bacterium]
MPKLWCGNASPNRPMKFRLLNLTTLSLLLCVAWPRGRGGGW